MTFPSRPMTPAQLPSRTCDTLPRHVCYDAGAAILSKGVRKLLIGEQRSERRGDRVDRSAVDTIARGAFDHRVCGTTIPSCDDRLAASSGFQKYHAEAFIVTADA